MNLDQPNNYKWRELHFDWQELLDSDCTRFNSGVEYLSMGLTRHECINDCPVDLGDFHTAFLKTIVDEIETSLLQPDGSAFISYFSHSVKHLFGMLESSVRPSDQIMDNLAFLDCLHSYSRAYEAIPSTYSYLERRSVSLMLGKVEEADRFQKDFKVLRQKIWDEEIPEKTWTDENLKQAMKILSDFVERFKKTPESNFDLITYLAEQKKQWVSLNNK